MKLIAGLGNPGRNYKNTRHNVGYMALEFLVGTWQKATDILPLGKERNALYDGWEFQRVSSAGIVEKIFCIQPRTFMNLSGAAVRRAVSFTGKDFDVSRDVWIIHDELDLELGRLKIDMNASAAGHNGVKNIIALLGTKDFIRFRIGIRPVEELKESADQFVLKNFRKEEKKIISNTVEACCHAIEHSLDAGIPMAQNIYNKKI